MLIIGLMSGTLLDGIDAALVRFSGMKPQPTWRLEAFRSTPYTHAQRERIHDAMVAGDAAVLCRLHADLGEWFAEAALELCRAAGVAAADIAAIGSHGQTLWHEPPTPTRRGATLQLGCAATIAERTGIPVISDFRSRDVAAGGQGAPLVPFADRLLFAADAPRVLVNIGGMANLTRVPAAHVNEPLLAFDTGPGNALIDAAVQLATQGEATFDAAGARAARGHIDAGLLAELRADPFFAEAPPRSTGRERFGRPRVQSLVARVTPAGDAAWCDLIATLTAFTAVTIADAVRRWILPLGAEQVIVSGGGARNPVLLAMLRAELQPLPVLEAQAVGIDADAKEAVAFAALAWAHLAGVPASVPEVTGARGARVLGSLTPA